MTDAERTKLWRLKNPEASRAQHRRHYERHRAKRLAAQKAYYAAHAEERREYARRWRSADPARLREANSRYYAKNPEPAKEAARRRRARIAGAPTIEKIDRQYVIARDRSLCHICGKRVAKRQIQLDHLVPLSKGGSHTHDNLAVAHARCNLQRHDGRIPAQLLLVG